jgi:hypothetical protein
MTTKVTVDAHAGWPVAVVTREGEKGYLPTFTTHIVEPNTRRDFYLHSGVTIISAEEMPLPKPE